MASCKYDPKRGTARIFFRLGGVQYNRVEPVESERHADRLIAQVEEMILDVERGKVVIPEGVDVKTFIMTGGKVQRPIEKVEPEPPPPVATLAVVLDVYFDTLTKGSKATSSLVTERVHAKHFKRLIGAGFRFDAISLAVAQKYVDKRAKEGVVRETLKKELGTLRVVWNWASKRKHVPSPPSWKPDELTLPKGRQKPPFQTWEQIERRVSRGDLDDDARAEMWECLWLDRSRMTKCLEWVERNAPAPFLHPMFAVAAFTGARRGEIVRSERTDWDFESGLVRIRQKKSDSSKDFTTRDVSIHPRLALIMKSWFDATPGGVYAIEDDGEQLTIVGATKWFRRTVDGGPWSVMRGWHVFRHSLASNMASAGVDQRVIDATLGHSTDAMARRYRHLLPQSQTDAIHRVFDED
jgi:integrase